ncbi:hypothetical protein G3I77_22865 [Streptomyces sp. D2-8]|uniref:hypothetical protein n=1 Tax=Streptomyces sp. D2-8 TaxID=2707767 RepID=UPI0020BE1024|nr:hypothetical protein [Streptomyces sp. D2-8]MCK8435751.1 hypothetical protein [Streptomyces sp. D2-8]
MVLSGTPPIRTRAGEYRLQLSRITSERDERASHWADKIRDELDDAIEDSFWDDAKGWLHDNADLFKTIGDLVGDLSGILGMLAIITMPFPPLGAIFATAAAVTSGIALLSHLMAKAGGADVSWFNVGLDALGAIPGISAFAKGVKAADGAAAVARAAQLGRGTRGVTTIGRNIVGLGDNVAGAVNYTFKGKNIGLWGLKHGGLIKAEGLMGRMTLVAEQTVHKGQWAGTRIINLAGGNRWSIDPMSNLGRGIDAGIKIAPKLVSIPTHIGELMGVSPTTLTALSCPALPLPSLAKASYRAPMRGSAPVSSACLRTRPPFSRRCASRPRDLTVAGAGT